MTTKFQLTPEQKRGITEVDALCREHGLPPYYDFIQAAAATAVAIRREKPTTTGYLLLCKALDGLRNDSAHPLPVDEPR